jgi:hypothetical protein
MLESTNFESLSLINSFMASVRKSYSLREGEKG